MKIIFLSIIITILLLIPSYLVDKQLLLMPSLLFFILIIFITYHFIKSKYFYLFIAILNLLYHLFFTYFQRKLEPWDVYNFFTHGSEVMESFMGMFRTFIIPLAISIIIFLALYLLSTIKLKIYPLEAKIKYPILIFLLLINVNSTIGFKLLHAALNSDSNPRQNITLNENPLYPIKKVNTNIILILGESMKYDDYVESKLKAQGHFYKKIYAGATNTDVSIPLLLNAKPNPLKLSPNSQTNLFKLAKRNNFITTFYSLQSEAALQYIKPYLQTDYIDNYQSFEKNQREPKYDFYLLDLLENIDFSQNNFIVLQQIGQHSPYKYFLGDKSIDQRVNYKRSIDYSFKLFKEIYILLKKSQKPFVLIFTSDHGEFTGENERWGHNAFEKSIYEVPFFSSLKLAEIRSHEDISKYLIYLLGYKELPNSTSAIINGTMQSREDGFIEIKY